MIPHLLADDEEGEKELFLSLWRSPVLWIDAVQRHWMCAEVLYAKASETNKRFQKYWRGQLEGVIDGTITEVSEDKFTPVELDLIIESKGYIDEFFLLAGYALECGLKGCLFAADPSLISDDLKVHSSITKHGLKELCDRNRISVSDDEESLLEVLTYKITHGKYPAPKRISDIPKQIQDLFGQKAIVSGLIDRIVAKLRSLEPVVIGGSE